MNTCTFSWIIYENTCEIMALNSTMLTYLPVCNILRFMAVKITIFREKIVIFTLKFSA